MPNSDERKPLRGFLKEEGYGTLQDDFYQPEISRKKHTQLRKLAAGVAVVAVCCLAATAMVMRNPSTRTGLLEVNECRSSEFYLV
jgi:hypothetical protein